MLESPELRWSFIRKIYGILTVQMLITVAVASVVVFVRPIHMFFATTSAGLGLYILLIIMPFIVLCPLYYYYQRHPVNLLLLGIFTVCISFAVGLTCAFTSGPLELLESEMLKFSAMFSTSVSESILFANLLFFQEQKWIIGVIFMVPVYASESIISLWKSKFSIECDILRICYEAFALYCFVQQLLEEDEEKEISDHSSFHDFICQPRIIGQDLYTIQKFGLVQYMILKTLCAFLALLREIFGVYGDEEFKWYYGQMWALYCLVQHHSLEPIKPCS